MKKATLILLAVLVCAVVLVSCGGSNSPAGLKYEFTDKSYDEFVKAMVNETGRSESYIKEDYSKEDVIDDTYEAIEFSPNLIIGTWSGDYDEDEYKLKGLNVIVDDEKIGYFDKGLKVFHLDYGWFYSSMEGIYLNFYLSDAAKGPAGQKYEFTNKSYDEFVKDASKATGMTQAYIREELDKEDITDDCYEVIEFSPNFIIGTWSDSDWFDYEEEGYRLDGVDVYIGRQKIGYFDNGFKVFHLDLGVFYGSSLNGVYLNYYLKK